MKQNPAQAVERTVRVQGVNMQAMSGNILWLQAAKQTHADSHLWDASIPHANSRSSGQQVFEPRNLNDS